VRAVNRESNQREHTRDDCVPIQDSGIGAGATVGPEWEEKIAFFIQRYAANYIAERSAIENRKQNAGESEAAVKESAPNGAFKMHAQFNANAAQDEKP
jgi:hypothetical protein